MRGKLILHRFDTVSQPHLHKLEWLVGYVQGGDEAWRDYDSQIRPWHWIYMGGAGPEGFVIPHWFPVAVAGIGAATPWIIRRFNLRTLLLVVTMMALAMGAIVIAN